MPGAWERLSGFIRRQAIGVSGLFGTALLGGGVWAGTQTAWGTVLIAVGGAIFAAAALALLSVTREDLLEVLLRQGVETVFDSRRTYCTDDFWVSLLGRVWGHYRVLGVANHAYLGTQAKKDRFGDLFRTRLTRGVTVELLWLRPDIDLAVEREREENRRTRSDIAESILWFWELRESLQPGAKERLLLKEYHSIPSCGLTWADGRLVVTHYVVGQENLDSPGLVLNTVPYPFYRRLLATLSISDTQSNRLAQVYLDTYREVQVSAVEVTPERVQELRNQLNAYRAVEKPSEAMLRQERDAAEEVDA